MACPKFIVLNQKEESISTLSVKLKWIIAMFCEFENLGNLVRCWYLVNDKRSLHYLHKSYAARTKKPKVSHIPWLDTGICLQIITGPCFIDILTMSSEAHSRLTVVVVEMTYCSKFDRCRCYTEFSTQETQYMFQQ